MTSPAARARPLHRRIRADIEDRILSGTWPPGHRLPYEHELMAQYDCARMTVNKVMSGLAAAGLVERRRRAGSFVARPRVQSAVLEIPDFEAETRLRGEAYACELVSRALGAAHPDDPLTAAFPPGDPVLRLVCRHRAGARPFALEERAIGLAAVPAARGVDFAQEPPGVWLLRHVPWSEAEHRIMAVAADTPMAAGLDVPPGAACLVVERRTWRADPGRPEATITQVRQTFPGARYHLVARFTPGEA